MSRLDNIALRIVNSEILSNGIGDENRKLAFLPLTDLGNAERFTARNRKRFMFVPAIGWHWWDGRRWSVVGAEEVLSRAVHETVRAIQDEAEAIRGTSDDKPVDVKGDRTVMYSDRVASWGRASEAAAKLSAVHIHARPYMTRQASELDADPWKFNVKNGTIHIVAGTSEDPIRLMPHDPADLITKLAGVEYDPEATCPRFDRFLGEVQPRVEIRRFLLQWFGYSLTGDVGEQRLVFNHGGGRNGKSVMVEIVAEVAGDYEEVTGIETFLDQGRGRNAGAATPDLAILPGVRFLRTSEPEKGSKLAEALIKLVTGGEPIQARHLNRDFFKFKPAFKLTVSGNYKPRIDGTDDGIWRRVVLVPWLVKIAKENRDKSLSKVLKREGSGVLNRLLDGLRDYLDHGLVIPEEVEAATQQYREDSDPLGRFLQVAVREAPGERVGSTRLYAVFCAWAAAVGERQWSQNGLSRALKDRGWQSIQSNTRQWLDVELVASEMDFSTPPAPPGEGIDDD